MLAITAEPLGQLMAGPAIRSLELCRAAGAAGLPVSLVTLASCSLQDPVVAVSAANDSEIRRKVGDSDAVLIQGDVLNLLPWLARTDAPLVVDAYDPFHFEQLEQARSAGETGRRIIVRDCISTLNRQLSRADLVLAASQRQRDLWLGHLAALGRVNPVTYDADHHLGALIRIVPFGLPETPIPKQDKPRMRGVLPGIDDDSIIALWAGGLYDWFDPLMVVDAVAAAARREPRLRLVFLGASHPVLGRPTPTEQAVRVRAGEVDPTGSVIRIVDGWVPYEERSGWLTEADIAVLAHRPGLETEFAFRTRVLDHLWAGLPTVGTRGDVLVNEICDAGGGIAVDPGDRTGFAEALISLASAPARRRASSDIALDIAGEYRWSRVAEPLIQFCRSPHRAPDLVLSRSHRALLGIPTRTFRQTRRERMESVWAAGGMGLVARRALNKLVHR